MSSSNDSEGVNGDNSNAMEVESDSREVEENANVQNKRKVKKVGKRTKKGGKNGSRKLKYQSKLNDLIFKNLDKSMNDFPSDLSLSYSKNAKENFLYMPYFPLPDLSNLVGSLIEVRIASEFLSQSNKAFIERRIWGSDIYTSDSDPVCILQHSGYFQIKDLPPTDIEGVSLYLRVSKGRSTYNSSFKNGIKSKKLSNYQGHSIKPENYVSLPSLGNKNQLKEMASKMPLISEYERKKQPPMKLADNMYYTEFNMIFNLSYEMWLAYSLPAICDKGRDYKGYTSWKLKNKVLYIETTEKRYEISLNVLVHKDDEFLFEEFELFNFSEVKDPIEKDNDFMLKTSIPLSEEYTIPIYEKVDWAEFLWGETALKVRDKVIEGIKCFNYYNTK